MTSSIVTDEALVLGDSPRHVTLVTPEAVGIHGVGTGEVDDRAPDGRIARPRTANGPRAQRGDYTLGDLLGDSHLDLNLVAGSEDAILRPLLGAHSIELEHPARWLDSGWMMLTMGVRLRNKPQAQRDLVAELQELGASCLGFGVGHSFKSVPPALLDEARRRNFPVVLVPEDTQFRDITRAVFHSTVGMESQTFRRLVSLQQNLIRAFSDANALESIVRRLGRLVHSTVAVLSLDGEAAAATSPIPASQFAAELAQQMPGGITQATVGEWQILAAPVDASSGGPAARWLVLASHDSTLSGEFARAAIQVTVPLVDALLRLSATRLSQDRATLQSLLDSVLDDDPGAIDSRTLEARISALGVEFGPESRILVLRERHSTGERRPDHDVPAELESWLHPTLAGLNACYLLSRRSNEVVVFLDSGSVARSVCKEVTDRWSTVTIGIGRPTHSAVDIRASHRDAQFAVQHMTLRTDEKVLSFDELDLVTQLLAEAPKERFEGKVASIAGLLEDNPIQLEALRAYFAKNRDIKAAADSIYIHPNTLRYRLERLERALGRSLQEPSVTASLYCVLAMMSASSPDIDGG